ncbi:hypothetical protein GN156_29265, partial [bacterium LRH843]|nr:hypothetical protein [bacterium LRH843]
MIVTPLVILYIIILGYEIILGDMRIFKNLGHASVIMAKIVFVLGMTYS